MKGIQDTSSETLRQLMGNGLTYEVPRFQRDYYREVEQWEDLWQDMLAHYHRIRRAVRKDCCVSKTFKNHKLVFNLAFHYINFGFVRFTILFGTPLGITFFIIFDRP